MVKNDEQFEDDVEAVKIADLEQYKKSLILECVTGKREMA